MSLRVRENNTTATTSQKFSSDFGANVLVSANQQEIEQGLTLEQVVPMVTANPAKMLDREDEIGSLRPGIGADVTVLNELKGRFILRDNEHTEVVAESLLQPEFCLRNGKRHDAVAVILPEAIAA